MADPVVVSLTKDTWVKVATGVSNGMLWLITMESKYIVMTHRDTSGAAPANLNDAARVFLNGCNSLAISSTSAKDYYLYSIGVDAKVRVDL